jgi:hypothetical protein
VLGRVAAMSKTGALRSALSVSVVGGGGTGDTADIRCGAVYNGVSFFDDGPLPVIGRFRCG